jgi:hypothetical protein
LSHLINKNPKSLYLPALTAIQSAIPDSGKLCCAI